MNVAEIEIDLSRSIAQTERAQIRLAQSMDECYPHMVGEAERKRIQAAMIEIATAENELKLAAAYAHQAFAKWTEFIKPPEQEARP